MNISCPEMLTNLVNFRYQYDYRKLEKGVEPIKKWEIDWKMSILGSVILTVVINLLVFFIIR